MQQQQPGSQLLQQQFAAGLRVKQAERTGNFYKHIYVNSEYRNSATDTASDFAIFLQNEIIVPPDGNTRIKIHRANIPMTFYNVPYDVEFQISYKLSVGSNVDVSISLPAGYYNPSLQEVVGTETFDYGLIGRINKILSTGAHPVRAAISTSYKLQLAKTSGTGNMNYIRIYFNIPAKTTQRLNYVRRVLGYGITQTDPAEATTPTNSPVLQSPFIYGPYYYSELFIRINSIPINYDMIDAQDGAPKDILAVIPVTVDTFGQIITVGPYDSLVYNFAPNSRVSRLRLQLTYRDNTLVDLQGQDWSCVLSIIKENPDDVNPSQLHS